MSDEKEYTEESEEKTKTDFFGNPEKDAAGENVKETTTEGKESSDGDDEDDD